MQDAMGNNTTDLSYMYFTPRDLINFKTNAGGAQS